MARRSGPDLFEVLAERRRNTAQPLPVPAGPTIPEDAPVSGSGVLPAPRARTGREIVFSLDAAFVIFAAMMMLVGSAFYLGHQRGELAGRQRLSRSGANWPQRGELPILRGESAPAATAPEVPAEKWTLQFQSSTGATENERRLAELDAAHVLQHPSVAELTQEAYVFRKDGVFHVAVGLYPAKDADGLVKLQGLFRDGKVPAPPFRPADAYKGASRVQAGQLGTPLPPGGAQ